MADIDVRGQNWTMKLAEVPAHWQVIAICLRCSRSAVLPVRYLVEAGRVGARTTLGGLKGGRILRCTRCDSRAVKVKIETEEKPARRDGDHDGGVVVDLSRRTRREGMP
jgi:hypothetical protein